MWFEGIVGLQPTFHDHAHLYLIRNTLELPANPSSHSLAAIRPHPRPVPSPPSPLWSPPRSYTSFLALREPFGPGPVGAHFEEEAYGPDDRNLYTSPSRAVDKNDNCVSEGDVLGEEIVKPFDNTRKVVDQLWPEDQTFLSIAQYKLDIEIEEQTRKFYYLFVVELLNFF